MKTIALIGRIDSNNSSAWEKNIFSQIGETAGKEKVEFDAGDLEYLSSAGLRTLMKVQKVLRKKISVVNVSEEIYNIFETTGFTELFDIRKKLREISVEGLELLGEGANGKVYRLTKDEMIKVFREGIPTDIIEAERAASKQAFLLGVPCAIAFDTVRCGKSIGTIYETLNAKTVSEWINDDPNRLPELARLSAQLLKQLHDIEIAGDKLNDVTVGLHANVDAVSSYFSPDGINQMHKLYDAIPKGNRFVHNDFHPKNVMESNRELMLIDLGGAGYGNPIIDLIHSFMMFKVIGVNEENRDASAMSFVDLSDGDLDRFWEIFLTTYCGGKDEADALNMKLKPYAKMLYYLSYMTHPFLSDSQRVERADMLKKNVLEHYDEVIWKWE